MSIKLRFEKGSLITQVVLTDEALPGLNELVSKYQADEAAAPSPSLLAFSKAIAAPLDNSPVDPFSKIKDFIGKHTAAELLNQFNWSSNGEKILLMGALHEVASNDPWKSGDIEAQFKAARESFPGNFARDIANAISNGIITSATPRSYRVSRTGWNRIAEAIAKLQPES